MMRLPSISRPAPGSR